MNFLTHCLTVLIVSSGMIGFVVLDATA
jgi:hypothetical protein